jgi:hypothetical protein
VAYAVALEEEDLAQLLLPPIANFVACIEQVVRTNARHLELVRGNILIHIPDVATFTIVSSGSRKGLYYEATDDEIDFALVVEEWVLINLLDSEYQMKLEPVIEHGFLKMEGDFRVWERFMELTEQKNMLALRSSPASAPSKAKRRRAV